jgi:dTDP-L-rhamnose 4-epimerase
MHAPRERLRISGDYRPGDIRHAVADISRAASVLGWVPKVELRDGLEALATWAQQEFSRAGEPMTIGAQ